MHRIFILRWFPLLLLLTRPLTQAQQAEFPGGLVTAGTSAQDADGTWFGYVRWTPVTAAVTQGKAFAVYLKPGQPADAGSFARQGVVAPREDAVSLAVWLNRAQRLGESPADLAEMVDELRRHYGDAAPGGSLAQRLGGLVHRALGDAATSAALRRVARTSPAIAFATGTAWAGPLGVPSGQWATIEVREWNVAAQQDVAVIARVTLRAAIPALLHAPGTPVQVPDATATGDLVIRTRWAMEDPLRRQLPLMSGYNLWRVRKSVAQSLNWHATTPTAAQLDARALASPNDTRRVNGASPIAARALFRADTVAEFSPSATTNSKLFFFSDDNDRDLPGGAPFTDGEEFYYFAAARDLLNRSGLVSPGGLGMACRRMPPSTPTGLMLKNGAAGTTGALLDVPCLHLRWKANLSTPTDTTHRYEILRAQMIGGILTSVSVLRDPAALAGLTPLASLPPPATPGAEIVWTDPTLTLPDDYGRTFWYAVRAVYDGACGPIYSSPTSPVYGVLTRPDAAAAAVPGCTTVNCAFGGTLALATSDQANAPLMAREDRHVRITAQRLDAGVIAVNFTAVRILFNGATKVLLDELIRFDADDNNVATELFGPASGTVRVSCQAVLASGEMGPSGLSETILNQDVTLTRLVPFEVAVRSASDLMPGNAMDQPFFASLTPYLLTLTAGLEDNHSSGFNAALPDGPVVIYRKIGLRLAKVGPACVTAGRCFFSDQGNPSASYVAYRLAPMAPSAACRHLGEAADGRIVPVQKGFDLTERTTEYRLYRRVNDGPLDLVRQARKDYNAAFPHVTVADGGLPATCSTLDYYVQLIDRDGHAGALTPLPPRLLYDRPPPRPTLGDPEMIGDLASPKVRLTWSCPSEGLERFEILLTEKLPDPAARTGIINLGVDGEVNQTISILGLAKPITQFKSAVTATFRGRSVGPLVARTRVFTGRVGEDFLPGPAFTLDIGIGASRDYEVTIRALTTTGCLGANSVIRSFTWKPPPQDQRVPWPARPVPAPAPFNDGIRAEKIIPLAGFQNRDTTGDDYALGVRIGRLYADDDIVLFIRSTPEGQRPVFKTAGLQGRSFDSVVYPFAKGPAGHQSEKLLPVVLYRKQEPNMRYPDASGDLLQCSPLVENIKTQLVLLPAGGQQTFFIDNVVTLTSESENECDCNVFILYLLDTQPYVQDAKYHYYLVRFTGDGEIEQMIDAGAIDLAINPP